MVPEKSNIVPSEFIIVGGTGNLSKSKILPALFWRFLDNQIDAQSNIILCDKYIKSKKDFFLELQSNCNEAIKSEDNNLENWNNFIKIIKLVELDVVSGNGHLDLVKIIKEKFDENRPIIFYLAIASSLFGNSCKFIRDSGLNVPQSRLVIEKPIGKNKDTAIEINNEISSIFKENQIYRIDHYLGKETVQNLMVMRFANQLFEAHWNNNSISNVQITVSEEIGIKGRENYYDSYGAIKDMMQNHILQLVCLVAMEPPSKFDANLVRDEKLKVLQSLKKIENLNEICIGQYGLKHDDEDQIASYTQDSKQYDSKTETFVALIAKIDNWRWAGVPFFLRTGKRLKTRASEIVITFKPIQHFIFDKTEKNNTLPNQLIIRLQPDEGLKILLMSKEPGPGGIRISPSYLNLSFSDTFKNKIPDAYERLLMDVVRGNQTLFMRKDEVEAAWSWIDPIINLIKKNNRLPETYTPKSWGPTSSFDLLKRHGFEWCEPHY